MKPGKSLPHDDIDAKTIKDAASILAPAIKHIINLSLKEGQFASQWKPQIIAPHNKKDDRTDVANYRPVSNIVELGKRAEMEAGDQLVEHFMNNNLFHDGHHGSLPSPDTTTALLAIQKFMADAAERKEMSATDFFDQSSAFDLPDHRGPITWFESTLKNRTYQCKIGARRSIPRAKGPYGVPQGSVLGSLLYVIYQTDQTAAIEQDTSCQSPCYVDDKT